MGRTGSSAQSALMPTSWISIQKHRTFLVSLLHATADNLIPGQVIPPPIPVIVEGEEEWEVEEILDSRRIRGRLQYLTEWSGFATPTWEPEENPAECRSSTATTSATRNSQRRLNSLSWELEPKWGLLSRCRTARQITCRRRSGPRRWGNMALRKDSGVREREVLECRTPECGMAERRPRHRVRCVCLLVCWLGFCIYGPSPAVDLYVTTCLCHRRAPVSVPVTITAYSASSLSLLLFSSPSLSCRCSPTVFARPSARRRYLELRQTHPLHFSGR